MSPVVVTGASGFLGRHLVEEAGEDAVPIASPRRGGIDLTAADTPEQLSGRVPLDDPEGTVLVHAAARVAWEDPTGLVDNALMACHVARWARDAGVGFAVLVSSVNVYGPAPRADRETSCRPETPYGVGKVAAEHVWRATLPADRAAVVRPAGIWGWQREPTLFWNELLLAAARGPAREPPKVTRAESLRNYISAPDAARAILKVAKERQTGLHVAAGRDEVTTGRYVDALKGLPGSRLEVEWADDGKEDRRIYEATEPLRSEVQGFEEALSELWNDRPDWVTRTG